MPQKRNPDGFLVPQLGQTVARAVAHSLQKFSPMGLSGPHFGRWLPASPPLVGRYVGALLDGLVDRTMSRCKRDLLSPRFPGILAQTMREFASGAIMTDPRRPVKPGPESFFPVDNTSFTMIWHTGSRLFAGGPRNEGGWPLCASLPSVAQNRWERLSSL